jgi:DNA polymerase II small subunit
MKPSVGIRALLRARHLAPTYGQGVPIAPEREDLLVVDEVPDIVHCGHLGKPDDDMYRGTLMISTPKWIRVNHGVEGESGKAALVDLSTFQVLWRP